MKIHRPAQFAVTMMAFVVFVVLPHSSISLAQVGPATENRFPALTVPEGLKATLFACDPLVEYPSVIALGPRPGTLYVAYDYMTGLGTEIIRRDEIRLIEDTDADGYADRSEVFADGFNSIQGLAYDGESVYVMHAPFLTALRDVDGDGRADERRIIVSGLGLPPEENNVRLHCANGVTPGHDGWLYLALGDHGCDVNRPEGDRLILEGGGILRCRPDGSDLHLFATGLRNIYDVALDHELNVFTRDNENDGGDYMNLIYHSFHGADHGYPYLYYEHPEETMQPLAEVGLGSSAGGVCYLEETLPDPYRGNLIFAQWGKAVVRYPLIREEGSFEGGDESEFCSGGSSDRYPFKPTDVVVDYDGTVLISDWADGQRPKRGRGRIYRISPVNKRLPIGAGSDQSAKSLEELIDDLNGTSYHRRVAAQREIQDRKESGLAAVRRGLSTGRLNGIGRLHACWIIAHSGSGAVEELLDIARFDPAASVRAQAIRAIADLTDPTFLGRSFGDPIIAEALAALANDAPPQVQLETIIALGRLRWPNGPAWIQQLKSPTDAAMDHAIQQMLRRCENWPAVANLLELPPENRLKSIALRALSGQYAITAVGGLMQRLQSRLSGGERRDISIALTRVHRKPRPWKYWGYRPAPRPVHTEAWAYTHAIELALNASLRVASPETHLTTLEHMVHQQVPVRPECLEHILGGTHDEAVVRVILDCLERQAVPTTRSLLAGILVENRHAEVNRLAALKLFADGLDSASEQQLLDLADSIVDGPVLAAMVREIAGRPNLATPNEFLSRLKSDSPEVRAAALEALAQSQPEVAQPVVSQSLKDTSPMVRRMAVTVAGDLRMGTAADDILVLAKTGDPLMKRICFGALGKLNDGRGVETAASSLVDRQVQATALEYLEQFGDASVASAILEATRQDVTVNFVREAIEVLLDLESAAEEESARALRDTIATIQGETGLLVAWEVVGPLSPGTTEGRLSPIQKVDDTNAQDWQAMITSGDHCRWTVSRDGEPEGSLTWIGRSTVAVSEPIRVQFLTSSTGTFEISLDEKPIHRRETVGSYRANSDRFETILGTDTHRITVRFSAASSPQFHLRYRKKSSTADHERLTELALDRRGDWKRGREIFYNETKTQCSKCHRIGKTGGRIGPELSGAGNRFSTAYLVESILDPNRSILGGYQSVNVELNGDRTITGVNVEESESHLTVGDTLGELHVLPKAEIIDRTESSLSAMPVGLEQAMSDQEFLDLIAYLVSLK